MAEEKQVDDFMSKLDAFVVLRALHPRISCTPTDLALEAAHPVYDYPPGTADAFKRAKKQLEDAREELRSAVGVLVNDRLTEK